MEELLASRRGSAQSLLAALEHMRGTMPEPADRQALLRRAALDNGIAHARAELNWLATLQKELA